MLYIQVQMEGSFECTLLHLLPTQKRPTCKGHTKKLRIETKSSYYIQKTSQGNVTVFCYFKKNTPSHSGPMLVRLQSPIKMKNVTKLISIPVSRKLNFRKGIEFKPGIPTINK